MERHDERDLTASDAAHPAASGPAMRHARAERADERFVRGRGRYTDDINLPGQLHAAFLRAPFAHGELKSVDVEAARAVEGVVAVYTAGDVQRAGFRGSRSNVPPPGATGFFHNPPRPLLAAGRVRHVGEAIAMVVARSRAIAEEAAEQIALDFDTLPAVIDPLAAMAADAPQIWPEAPGNVSFEWHAGDAEAVAAAMERALRVAHVRLVIPRVAGNPLEPRSAIGQYDPQSGRYTLHSGSQGAPALRDGVAEMLPDLPPNGLRVITPDVGGGFGLKTSPYPEHALLLFAARETGAPVKWTASRGDSFLSDNHGRDSVVEGWLAVDADGRFLALRAEVVGVLGAYLSRAGTIVATRHIASGLAGPYRTPLIAVRSRGVFANTMSTGPYRGAGRPESSYLAERLIEEAARELQVDPVELRRRNLIAPEQVPYRTPLGHLYDSGDFGALLDKGLAEADWAGFAARRAASEAQGKLRGRGLALFLEIAGGILDETAEIRISADGLVELRTASQSNGQGHDRSLSAAAARILQIPQERIVVIEGDTDETPGGPPSVASRSAMMTGGAIVALCRTVIERARRAAAEEMEVAEGDLDYADGAFTVRGTDLRLGLLDLAARLRARGEGAVTLDGTESIAADHPTFPSGCHVAEVEIDRETGSLSVVAYTAIEDVGTVLNEAAVEGQIMGGVTQGLGETHLEACLYDADGQLVTGSFNDYAMPRAWDVPAFRLGFSPTLSPATPLGAKGAGEAGTTGALPAIMNAVNDALASAGAAPVDMPAKPEILLRRLREAANG
ncbi:xanthine dehydrogenase family protein molybdopterin-binding subunit [Faunimonas sp. B44]|uniref:xanthine dehydrogenase family protein molybdopterin-binding subunit n=1 Tax=Faunimonas sp. B44 TaxID=3461493 RepID=UPI00404398DC